MAYIAKYHPEKLHIKSNIEKDIDIYIKELDNEMMSRSHIVLKEMYGKYGIETFQAKLKPILERQYKQAVNKLKKD